jgi:hypothetical protein
VFCGGARWEFQCTFLIGVEFVDDLHEILSVHFIGIVLRRFLVGFGKVLQVSVNVGAVLVKVDVAIFYISLLFRADDFRDSDAVRQIRVVLSKLGQDVEWVWFASRST